MEQTEFKTKRLLLRAAQPSDYKPLYTPFSDTEVMRYRGAFPHKHPDETRLWLNKMLESRYNGTTDFIIVDRATDMPIGKIGVWNEDGEIGFLLARSHWRRGLTAEAMSVLVPYLFERLGYEKVVADVDPGNEGSLALLAKFGFLETGRREGSMMVGEDWVDSVDLELTREEWFKRGKRLPDSNSSRVTAKFDVEKMA